MRKSNAPDKDPRSIRSAPRAVLIDSRHDSKSSMPPSVSNNRKESQVSDTSTKKQAKLNPHELVTNYDEIRRNTSRKTDEPQKKKGAIIAALATFCKSFITVIFSPLFLRHRNVFYFCLELFVPPLVALIIFSAFTAGISWKQAQHVKIESSTRNIKFPHITMHEATTHFRSLNTNSRKQALIFFTPVNDFTIAVMQKTLEILELSETNVVFKRSQSSFGAVGVNNSMEMFERALMHRNERLSHGQPVAVVFRYDPNDVSNLTKVPYNVTYSISNFDESIAQTKEPFPFVPPVLSEKWETPYLTSGFIGLQFAIEDSIIRLILERQKASELQGMVEDTHAKGRALQINGRDEENLLNSDEIDEDLLNFLIAETLEKIKKERERRERLKALGEDPRGNDRRSRVGGRGRSLGNGGVHHQKHLVRPITSEGELPLRSLKAFSYDHPGSPKLTDQQAYVVTFSLVVAYSIMSFFIVKHIAEENLSGIKELLKIHGLSQYIHWTMLFFHAIIFRAISSGLILLAMRIDYGNGKIAGNADASALYILLYVHQLSITFLNYFIGCYIKSVKMCGIIAVSLSALSFYVPEIFSDMKLIGKVTDIIVGILFPNWAFRHCMRSLLAHESDEKSVDWDNIMENEGPNSNLVSIGEGIISMGLVGLLYLFLAIYMDIASGSHLFSSTVSKFQSFRDWLKKTRRTLGYSNEPQGTKRKTEHKSEYHEDDFPKPPIYEEPHPDKECYVQVRNLSKYYNKHKVALDSLSIDVMHEEITVVLGHSGCGKSTLISILAGMVQPSNGFATVYGFDVSSESSKARKFIGVCPQKLVSFNLLTVREHLYLCYKLRGYPSKECNGLASTILTQMKLWNLRSFFPSKLTKDELRRLSMAMALADAPKIILLDEPTRSMDAIGRREVWDIILSLRHHHTIIVTTNYMDEAEHLADKLALLAHGRLVCVGSLDYLKQQYDTGYFLKLIPFNSMFIDTNAVVNYVRSILGEHVSIKRHKRLKDLDTLELELPSKEKDRFADFCDELEKKKDALHVMKYSIRQVHLNDIFIKICTSVAADGYALDLYVRRDSAGDIKTVLTSAIPEIPEDTEKTVSRVNFFTSLLQRSWTVLRNRKFTFFLHYFIPLVVIWTVVHHANLFVQSKGENPEMALNQEKFGTDLRVFSRITADDPSVNYSSHISRVLSAREVHVDKEEPVISKLYDVVFSDPKHAGYVKDQHMIAIEFGKYAQDFEIVGYFASGALHSAPLALNVMNNVILSVISEPERNTTPNWRSYSVAVNNDPMPQVQDGQFENGCGVICMLLAMLMSFAYAFIVHTCCLLPMMERENGMKHIILMCGVEPSTYWFANFVVDLLIMFLISVTVVLIFLSDLYQTFYSSEVLFAVWLICASYLMWSGLLYCYYVTSIIPSSFNGYNFLAVLHLFGIILVTWMIFSPPDSGFGIFFRNLILVLFPPYTITSALYHFFSNSGQRNICRNINTFVKTICDDSKDSHLQSADPAHVRSTRSLETDISNIDPKFTRCCARRCKVTKSCFRPPTVFNSSTESWETPELTTEVCVLFLQGFIFCGLVILAERKVFSRLAQHIMLKFLQIREMQKVASGDDTRSVHQIQRETNSVEEVLKKETWPEDVALVCQDMTKSSTSTMKIKNFNLQVKTGQCVAILGRGDSGKSSIIRMMAGEQLPTRGNCYMKNVNLVQNRREYLSHIGYCPQKSSYFPDFTGAQMLKLMGSLRGIPSSILSIHINKWMSIMGLAEVANDPCEEYGDGMRQRLRAAMSLIGEPDIIILDEPTTGVDPSARERLWCVLEHLNQKGFTIVFTTFSTDEAFSLADRVVVLAEGNVQIIGTPEKIQQTYAQGHTIIFRLRHDVVSSLELISMMDRKIGEFKVHVNETYNYIDLLDEHDEMLMFFLRDARVSWAEAFRKGHYLASMHDDIIESYEVTEGGVDDIFVFLTNKYHELNKPRESNAPVTFPPPKDNIDEMKELKKAQERYKYSKY